jgi:hypothetical protein
MLKPLVLVGGLAAILLFLTPAASAQQRPYKGKTYEAAKPPEQKRDSVNLNSGDSDGRSSAPVNRPTPVNRPPAVRYPGAVNKIPRVNPVMSNYAPAPQNQNYVKDWRLMNQYYDIHNRRDAQARQMMADAGAKLKQAEHAFANAQSRGDARATQHYANSIKQLLDYQLAVVRRYCELEIGTLQQVHSQSNNLQDWAAVQIRNRRATYSSAVNRHQQYLVDLNRSFASR